MNSIKHIIPKLTAEEKELVRDVLEKEDRSLWIDRLALAPSAGLGIRMSQSTLYRLKQQLELEENLSDRDSIKDQARAVANEEQNATLESPAINLLREKAFSLAASKDRADLRTACRIPRSSTPSTPPGKFRKNSLETARNSTNFAFSRGGKNSG